MQVDLPKDGPFLFTGDQFHVKENYTKEIPQGMCHEKGKGVPTLLSHQSGCFLSNILGPTNQVSSVGTETPGCNLPSISLVWSE